MVLGDHPPDGTVMIDWAGGCPRCQLHRMHRHGEKGKDFDAEAQRRRERKEEDFCFVRNENSSVFLSSASLRLCVKFVPAGSVRSYRPGGSAGFGSRVRSAA